jgi:hypothetical protein
MPHGFQVHPAALLLLAVAGSVAVFVPPSTETETAGADTMVRYAVYADCKARTHVPGAAAPTSGTTPRTQSPAWLQQRQAETIHCLHARLPDQVLSASR